MIPGSSFLGWQGGANQEAADHAIRTGEPAKANWYQKLFGATDQDAQNIVLRERQRRLNDRYGGTMAQLGLTGADWGETEQDVLGKISRRSEERTIGQRNRQEARAEQSEQRALTQALQLKDKDIEAQREQNNASLQANAAQYAHSSSESSKRYSHESEQRALDRSLERQLSNNSNDLQMQISLMNADLADKRMAYDRETNRLDRRDRMIAQLMSGLGSLGGAFSL